MATPEITPRMYAVKFRFRPRPNVPSYEERFYTETAYTAEDAVTQLRVRFSGYLELLVLSVEPIGRG
jgi:hypothetical protein